MKKHYLLNEVAKLVGVPGYRISYAITNGRLPEPAERVNNHRLFTSEDIDRLMEHFGRELGTALAKPRPSDVREE